MPGAIGKLSDPVFRHERARKAANARTSADYHIKAIAARAPELTAAQLEKLALILNPGRGDAQAT